MRYLFLSVLFLLISACSPMPKAWQHDTASQEQYEADQADCMAEANTAKEGVIAGANSEINAIYDSCMAGKGYYR